MSKTRFPVLIFLPVLFILTLTLALSLLSCHNPLRPSFYEMPPPAIWQGEDGEGAIRLTIGRQDPARTILPSWGPLGGYMFRLTFSGVGTPPNMVMAPTYWLPGEPQEPIGLLAGTWDLQVSALLPGIGPTDPPREVASGYLDGLVVIAGEIVDRDIRLYPIRGGSGTFEWHISYPPGVTSGVMEITPAGNTVPTYTLQFTGTPLSLPGLAAVGNPASITLPSGEYHVVFTLYNDRGERALRRAVLRIYQNLDSRFVYTDDALAMFAASSFFPRTPLDIIIDSWNGAEWAFDPEMRAAHLNLWGIRGVSDANFANVVYWLNSLSNQFVPPDDPPGLFALFDAALIMTDLAAIASALHVNRDAAQDAIALRAANDTPITFNWTDNRTLNVSLGIYTIEIVFNDDVLNFTLAQGGTLADQLAWLRANAVSDGNYLVLAGADEPLSPAEAELPSGRTGLRITLRSNVAGAGGGRTVSLAANGSLFAVDAGVTLVFDNNITLRGSAGNDAPLVTVNSGGILEMREGSAITGNTNTRSAGEVWLFFGSGVRVNANGVFTMYGGRIHDNIATVSSQTNAAGVQVIENATFTMHGGEIFSNTSYGSAGGVRVAGTFNMLGGRIFDNRAYSHGGGVHVGPDGIVRVSGGTIYGNDEPVYMNTAPNNATLHIQLGGTAQHGTFDSGGAFTQIGTLVYEDRTIEVVNGVLIRPIPAPDGEGTPASPFLIINEAQLRMVGRGTGDFIGWNLQAHYRLAADIPLAAVWTPIPNGFTGSFDGRGHSISGMTISGAADQAMFASIGTGGAVRNLALLNATVTATGNNAGSIAGTNQGEIANVFVTGTISGSTAVGGIAGSNTTGAVIINSVSIAALSGTGTVGGIVGNNPPGATVANSVALGTEIFRASGSVDSFGRISGTPGGSRVNNHARYNMSTPVALEPGVATRDGADITSTQWSDMYWWRNTAFLVGQAGNMSTADWDFMARHFPPSVPVMPQGTTPDNPFLITNEAQLRMVGRGTGAYSAWNLQAHYRLTTGITLAGNWTPVPGTFTGSFDGEGHSIGGMTISGAADQAMFASIGTGGAVRNLALVNTIVTATGNNAGSIAGTNRGLIENIFVTGTISGVAAVGGIAGNNTAGAVIRNSVTVVTAGGTDTTGGITGNNYAGAAVVNSVVLGLEVARTGSTSTTFGRITGSLSGILDNNHARFDMSLPVTPVPGLTTQDGDNIFPAQWDNMDWWRSDVFRVAIFGENNMSSADWALMEPHLLSLDVDVPMPPGEGGFTIRFEDLAAAADITLPSGQTLSLGGAPDTRALTFTLENPALFDPGSIRWYFAGTRITATAPVLPNDFDAYVSNGGAALNLRPRVNGAPMGSGVHYVTLGVSVNGVPFSRRVSFTVVM